MRIGFIGLGRMGMRMAPHLLAAGFDLTVYNRTAERCRPLAERGATVAASPAELAATSDVVVTMVSDQEAADAVLLGATGALTTLRTGSAVIDMSTIGPAAARALARAASEHGVDFLDAPVSGSTAAAEAATLVTMVGGERAAAYAVLAGSAVASPYVTYKQGHFLNPSAHPVTFTPRQMQKDLDLALGLARDVGLPLFTAAAANQVLSAARGLGYGDMDMVRVADVIRSLSA